MVTGAARGIGEATATLLARRGADLLLTDIDQAALDDLAARLTATGTRVEAVACDVRDLGATQAAVARAVEAFGGIDVVVANAGVASYGTVLTVDPDAFRRVLDTNVLGVFHTVRAALPTIIERRGYVLVVSSLAALAATPGMAAYDASKAGVEHFANALRMEVAHLGVDVGSAHMSWIDTPLLREAREDMSSFDEMLAALPAPLRAVTSAEDCAKAFVEGIEARKRQVFVPGWLSSLSRLRMILNSRLGDRMSARDRARLIARTDTDVRRLGRSTGPRYTESDVGG
ncbi:short-chain dehydrogenase [Nocardioides sp. Soil805]|nr:short-chain dehydrogenase [Nocardioides sp. Soil805]